MSSQRKPKVLFILGHAFSGSTLFALALGTDKRLLNLGEVTSLEGDYHCLKHCTCGELLHACPFYTRLKHELRESQGTAPERLRWHLENEVRPETIDRRHRYFTRAQNLQLAAGLSVFRIFPDAEIADYLRKNELFFEAVTHAFPAYHYIVDCSKSATRLEILLTSQTIDLRVIYLHRPAAAIFASTQKRVKKRYPRSHANLLNRCVVACGYALWQRSSMLRCRRVFQQTERTKRLWISFNSFVETPRMIMNSVQQWLGLEERDARDTSDNPTDLIIRPCDQHIYVGNRWIFQHPEAPVELKLRNDIDSLTPEQHLVMRLILRNEILPKEPEKTF